MKKRGFDTHQISRPPKHIGIYDFCNSRKGVKFIATCDADTFYPKGSIKKLLQKAFHPSNKNVSIFQSHLAAFPGKTFFSKFLSIGQNTTAQIYAQGFFNLLGNGGYYGSGALIKRGDFARVAKIIQSREIIKTKNIKSHDVWEATILSKIRKEVRYCMDVKTYESFPNNYMEMVVRDKRWMKGTIQSIKSLFVLSRKNTLTTYGVLLFPISMYIIQPIFVLFIILGILRIATTQNYSEVLVNNIITIFILVIIFTQKFLAVRSLKDIKSIFLELFFSTLFYLNTPIITTINVLTVWIPKQIIYSSISKYLSFFWINQILGLSGFLLFFITFNNSLLMLLPFFGILTLSGTLSYLFQFEIPKKRPAFLKVFSFRKNRNLYLPLPKLFNQNYFKASYSKSRPYYQYTRYT